MISHTSAFATYRALSQQHLDFAVLVCTAVPALQPELNDRTTPLKHAPDHFKLNPDTKKQLVKYATNYQTELARTNLITLFSYFESYVRIVLQEIIAFHGGDEDFRKLALRRASVFLKAPPPAIETSKRKLQEPARIAKKGKYIAHSKKLDQGGFRFPTELLAYFGSVNLIAKSKDSRTGMRAWEIPDILQHGVLYPLSAAERKLFDDCRNLRNDIAHGKAPTIKLKQSLKFGSDLHALAAKVDKHLIEHFFVLQAFV
jgi:hypothetical protein